MVIACATASRRSTAPSSDTICCSSPSTGRSIVTITAPTITRAVLMTGKAT